MPAPTTTVEQLAARKQALVAQAELHRQIIEIERFRLQERVAMTRDRIYANRFWLLGGLAAAGWISTRRLRSVLKLATAGMSVWRMLQKFRSQK